MRYAGERSGEDPTFTKHPSTWLNAGCWADQPRPPHKATSDGGRRTDRKGTTELVFSLSVDGLRKVMTIQLWIFRPASFPRSSFPNDFHFAHQLPCRHRGPHRALHRPTAFGNQTTRTFGDSGSQRQRPGHSAAPVSPGRRIGRIKPMRFRHDARVAGGGHFSRKMRFCLSAHDAHGSNVATDW